MTRASRASEASRILLGGLLAAGAAALLTACRPPERPMAEEAPVPEEERAGAEAGDEPMQQAANTLSAEERAEGWELLFDGESLEKWRGFRMESIPAGWTVDGGAIHFVPPEQGQRADLVTREAFADFDLKLEWKVTPGANSGVFFRVSEDAERTYHTGPEYQILDDGRHRDGEQPITSAGSNYGLHAPAKAVTRRVGEWNEARIRADGARVTHWLNGVELLSYELWTDEWRELVASSKFVEWPGYGMNESGHVALQDHGDEVWFRNVKILRLQ